ncbi:hypothetical protein O3P69_009231 [Scylla paramamosain]|uniref:Uncharacterized protein n=1 Tax=Scylla paramamosain TaxID=85552 RepID=A0AAW0TAC2_SCYPA
MKEVFSVRVQNLWNVVEKVLRSVSEYGASCFGFLVHKEGSVLRCWLPSVRRLTRSSAAAGGDHARCGFSVAWSTRPRKAGYAQAGGAMTRQRRRRRHHHHYYDGVYE